MRYFLIALFVMVFDQGTKIFIRSKFTLYESKEVIKKIFHITYIENPGAAFGIFANQRLFFLIVTSIVIVFIIYFMTIMEKEEPRANIFLAMVIGGAIGNLIDRVIKGTVTDFFDFLIWPVFNIADSFIVVGMIAAAFFVIRSERKDRGKKVENNGF